ncbi:MAG: hypothetical protein U5R30_01150 [Deltaproteobacteria bacterium]|nr:hypothetical protein [Deltaproteobacteria bacterium]
MSTTDYGNNSETKWNALKSRLYALTRKSASRVPNEREDVLRTIQDLNMPIIENSSGIEQLKTGATLVDSAGGKYRSMASSICAPDTCGGPGFPGQGCTVKNRGHGSGSNGRRFEETGAALSVIKKCRFETNLEIRDAKGGERRAGAPHVGRHPVHGCAFK